MYPRQAPLHEILILEAVFLKDEVSRYLRTTYIFIFQTILHWQKKKSKSTHNRACITAGADTTVAFGVNFLAHVNQKCLEASAPTLTGLVIIKRRFRLFFWDSVGP